MPCRFRRRRAGLGALLLTAAAAVPAAPHRPASDAEVLERLPARAADPRLQQIAALQRRLAAAPRDAATAAQLAAAYFDLTAADGDPRWVGYAQAALAPWWDAAATVPAEVRVMRAVLRQFGHDFDAARADLQAVVAADPGDGAAWSWLAAIALVQARYADARVACDRLQPLAPLLVGAACRAQVDALTGRAAPAAAALTAALRADTAASPAQRLWALTRLAEIEERLGHAAAAEADYRAALALGLVDGYLLAAYADLLLDQRRPAEVLTLLRGQERSDVLLLRLALAASGAQRAAWQADLAARFDAARLRGDRTHEKEESRFALALQNQPQRALQLAAANFRVQREVADARVLLEAAVAARDSAAAQPVLDWMDANHVEAVVLQALAAQLKAPR